jgi:hypothetical protein
VHPVGEPGNRVKTPPRDTRQHSGSKSGKTTLRW